MDKQICKCYHTKTERYYRYNEYTGEPIRKEREVGICYGTQECEQCKCGGRHEEVRFLRKGAKWIRKRLNIPIDYLDEKDIDEICKEITEGKA